MKYLMLTLIALVSLAVNAAAPKGWIIAGSAPNDYEFGLDEPPPSHSRKEAFIKAKPSAEPSGFGTLMQMVSADDYRGGRWRLSARMRTEDAAKAHLWMRVDGPDRKVNAFDNMGDRPITGDTKWRHYEIVLDVSNDSVAVAFGFFLSGGGQVWADDFKLERVPASTPVTGKVSPQQRTPVNLDFEE